MEKSEPEIDLTENLIGTVGRILFPRTITEDDTGFRIFTVESRTGEFCVKGTMPDVVCGMTVSCDGIWEMHKSHGRQFKANLIKEHLPADLGSIRAYLVKAKIGFGPVSAQRAIDAFGTDVFDILDNHTERLTEVKGLKGKTLTKIMTNWREKRASHTIMLFLAENGVPPAMSHKVYKHMGGDGMSAEGVIERLKANPYLIAEISSIGFKTADTMARGLGISPESVQRAVAGLGQTMREASSSGHTILSWKESTEITAKLLGQPLTETDSRLRVGIEHSTHLQIVMHDDIEHVALTALRRAGQRIAKELRRIRLFGTPLLSKDSPLLNGPFQVQEGLITLDKSQEAAVRLACTNSISIITGRPGSGKTASLQAIIDIADRLGRKIKCYAPTGLASIRLAEATGMESSTIHRMLGVGQAGHTKEKINMDLGVGDEWSMVDIFLMADFLEAVPAGTSIIFVGDIDQLPSVGAGNVLYDMISSNIFPVVRLTEIHRQKHGLGKASGIVEGAHAVIEGRIPEFNDTDFRFIEQNNAEKAAIWFSAIVKKMHEAGTPYRDIQGLSPMRERGFLSVANLNSILQEALNPKSPEKTEIIFKGTTYRVGDRVRQTKNDYELGIVNGDIGYINTIDLNEGEILVDFTGERQVSIDRNLLDNLTKNFAGTIHSSQGSGFKKVIIALHDEQYIMLNRNLLYTAITRSIEQCVIIGSKRALAMACRTLSNSKRYTDLIDLLGIEFLREDTEVTNPVDHEFEELSDDIEDIF